MNNEEKILAILAQLQQGQILMQADISGIKDDLSEVKQRVLKVELTQENVVAKQINLLSEGHVGIVEKLQTLDALTDKVEDIQVTVDVLKHVAAGK